MEFFCLEAVIEDENEVRLDAFVGSADIAAYGFKTAFVENGRQANLRRIFNILDKNDLKKFL